jgi:pPIWI RE three-gene island domain Z
MRDRSGWHRPIADGLARVWPADLFDFTPGDLLDIELGLFLLSEVMPTRPAADAWTLFGGYPYSEAFGDVSSEAERLKIRRARHYLWDMRRRREWRRGVDHYLAVPQELRGYDLAGLDSVPERREPAHAADRFDHYRRLLSSSPAFEHKPLPIAGAGRYRFPVRDRSYAVTFTEDLLAQIEPGPQDEDSAQPGGGAPTEPRWAELKAAAIEMDGIEAAEGEEGSGRSHWADRFERVELLIRDADGQRYVEIDPETGRLRIDSLLHMVGMVGAGKSTIRDILAYWAARQGLRVTIVVGDVAEELAVTRTFERLKVTAAPVIGRSTRERHIQRLHRRVATSGAPSLLAHQHPGFRHLSSACPVDALRGLEAGTPLRIGEAPCTTLYAADKSESPTKAKRHGCPLWSACPRQHSARTLATAQIWVANPASLVHSGVPQHLTSDRVRYLERACRRSDLIIIDEADRVQLQLDAAFAPSTTLVGRYPNSWLDEVAGHKIEELARHGRIQLSAHEVAAWTAAVDTVTIATNRIYSLLIQDEQLRKWITEDYFSALTLHQWLINAWFPDLRAPCDQVPALEDDDGSDRVAQRERMNEILNRFRDDPLRTRANRTGTGGPVDAAVGVLVRLALELLHTQDSAQVRAELRLVLMDLLGQDPRIEAEIDDHLVRFEFTLLLAVLHHRLDFMTMLWTRVEAALNLDSTSNVLSRRPPKDFEPIIPESPMGNVLGFQFQLGERHRDGGQSGELRFFRCSGVGRELLHVLHELPAVDGRPAPKVLLMSATSWAGTSTRYHVHAPVGAILRPNPKQVAAIMGTTFRKEFLTWPVGTGPAPADPGRHGQALRLSGSDPAARPLVLNEMLRQLATPDRSLVGSISLFDQELADIGPDRRRILLLVGSYAEAKRAFDYLNGIPEWTGRVTRLISDDTDLDDSWQTLRRGDVATFPGTGGEILVAPMLAVERGHNIVNPDGKAAIGVVYFLARPHPRPDDITLAIQAVNDWAVRQVRYGEFRQSALAAGSPDAAGLAFRRSARAVWNRYLTRRLAWSSLPPAEQTAFTWDQLVVMWQVIGRLVRGGVPARAIFVDAAFSPKEAGSISADTAATSLLVSMREVLAPYFSPASSCTALDRSLVEALYEPLYRALEDMD